MGEDNWTSGGKKGDFRILQPVGISKTSSLVSLRPRGSDWFSGAHPESPEQNWDYNPGDLVCFEKYYTIQKDRLVVKNPPANAGDIRDAGLIPRSGRSPAGGHGNPLQYSHLENPTDRGPRQFTVCGAPQSWTKLKWPGTPRMMAPSRVSQKVDCGAWLCGSTPSPDSQSPRQPPEILLHLQ